MSQVQTENKAEEDSSLNEREEEESESIQKSNTEDRSGNQLLFDDKKNDDYRKTRSFRDFILFLNCDQEVNGGELTTIFVNSDLQYQQSPARLLFLN